MSENNIESESENNDKIVKCYRLSKTVRMFSMIDIFFGCFYAFYSFFYLLPLLIALYGYHSAKSYHSSGVLTYSIYQILNNIMRLTLCSYYYIKIKKNNNIDDYSNENLGLCFVILSNLLGLYIARFSYKLYKSIKSLSDEEHTNLILLNYPIRIIYW
uniref:Uncharacterized protein n=1 Tax=viral metagenome TaxID=1070528 RepID=A0A6C0J5Q4_9ZZZZ